MQTVAYAEFKNTFRCDGRRDARDVCGFAVRLTPVIFLFLHHQPKKSAISKIEKKKM